MQQQRPAYLAGRDAGRRGHRVDHDALQGSLPQLPDQQLAQEPLLDAGGPPEEVRQHAAPRGLGARAGLGSDLLQRGVDLGHGERIGVSRRRRLTQRRPAHADLALPELAGQVGHRRDDLGRLQPAQAVGEPGDLAEPTGDAGDRVPGLGELTQQHPPIIAQDTDNGVLAEYT